MRIHEEVRKMPFSPIRAWTQRLHDLGPRAELTLGEPVQSTDPRIGEAAAAALRQGLTHYPPAAGLKSLRELLAEREQAQRGWQFRPEQILITDGAQEALAVCCLGLLNPGDEVLVTDPGYPGTLSALALASATPVFFPLDAQQEALAVCCLGLLNPGDEVLVTDPGYPGTLSALALASATPVFFPLDAQGQPEFAAMERAVSVKTRAILVASPNNPTGQILSAAAWTQLAALAEKQDLALIVDAAYEQLSWKPLNFKALRPCRHRVIFIGSFSKTYAMTGWRLGWISAPRRWGEALLKTHQALVSGVAGFVQQAACTALTLPVDPWRQTVAEQSEYSWQRLNEIGLTCPQPEGSFYCFPSIVSTGLTSEQFALKLAEQAGVAVLPGTLFGQHGAGHVRLSVCTDWQTLDWALDQIEKWIKADG